MTDNEIIKALPKVAYGGHFCNKCKYKYEKRADNNYLFETMPHLKSEAITELAEKVVTALDERVSENIRNRNPHWYIAKRIVRETAIEMTEGKENE